jgi:hypothetical protein
MAISANEKPAYMKDWYEITGTSYLGYAEKVLEVLEKEGLKDINKRKIYNVVSGSIKDRTILNAIRKVVLPQHHEPQFNTKINSKHLNLS